MENNIILQESDYINIIRQTPSVVEYLYYEIKEEKGVNIPRKDSVIKVYKEKVSESIGFDFSKLLNSQQIALISLAEVSYKDIRQRKN